MLRQERNDVTSRMAPPCTLYFQGIVCPKPCFLILIPYLKLILLKRSLFVMYHTNGILKVQGFLNHAYWFYFDRA